MLKNKIVLPFFVFCIGVLLMFGIERLAESEIHNKKKDSKKNIDQYVQTSELKKEEKKIAINEKQANIIEEPSIAIAQNINIPSEFEKYIVFVEIDFKTKTDKEKAILNIQQACSVINTSPLVKSVRVIGVQGQVPLDNDTLEIFDLEIK